MDTVMNSLNTKGLVNNLVYQDDIPLNNYGQYNSSLVKGFHSLNQTTNSRMGNRLGGRDINTLTDREYDRLVSLLNRLANI